MSESAESTTFLSAQILMGGKRTSLDVIFVEHCLSNLVRWSDKPGGIVGHVPVLTSIGRIVFVSFDDHDFMRFKADRSDDPGADIGAAPALAATPEWLTYAKFIVLHALDDWLRVLARDLSRLRPDFCGRRERIFSDGRPLLPTRNQSEASAVGQPEHHEIPVKRPDFAHARL